MRTESVTHFSILVCHLPERAPLLLRLMACVEPQMKAAALKGFVVSCHIATDDRRYTVGAKRNELLRRAKGEYVAFVDDDDMVSDDYVEQIRVALQTKPDVVGIHGILRHLIYRDTLGSYDWQDPLNLRLDEDFFHSIDFKEWSEKPASSGHGKIYFRHPNHLNPVKRHLAARVGFPEEGKVANHGEDHDYSKRLLPLLKTEVKIDAPIYYYLTR